MNLKHNEKASYLIWKLLQKDFNRKVGQVGLKTHCCDNTCIYVLKEMLRNLFFVQKKNITRLQFSNLKPNYMPNQIPIRVSISKEDKSF